MKKITFLKEITFKSFLMLLCLLFLNALDAQTIYTSASALQTAVNGAASTGGTFYVKDGSYASFKVSITGAAATADRPIIIKSQTIGGVTLTGDSNFAFKKSSNITLQGFNFNCTGNSTIVKLEGSNNIRITRNVFKLATANSIKWLLIGGVYDDITEPYQFLSHHNRVDHNIFKEKNTPGHYITVDGTNSKVQSQYDRIDHNYFKDNSPRAVNEQESIRVGWSNMSKSSGFTTVEFNLFENCDGDPEVLSVKSCDNIIRHNTFRGNYGTLSFRHGNRNRAEGNYFFGNGRAIGTAADAVTKLYTGGMRVYGTDHIIINNYFEGLNGTKWDAPITITQGDAIEGSSTDLTKHFRAERILIAYNTLVNNDQGIEIGFTNNGAYTKAVSQITIANNLITSDRNSLVKIVDGKDQGTAITWNNNLMYPTGTASVITGGTTTTSFTAVQSINQNPNLVFNSSDGTWRSSATTPLYANGSPIAIDEDGDGQSRPEPSNPGSDHYSTESVRYMPMTATTVGPNAYEDDIAVESLVLSPITNFIAAGESKTTTISANVPWTASVDNASWISINNASGTNNGAISITVLENTAITSRSGRLTVSGGTLTRTLTITQDGKATDAVLINSGTAGAPVTATADKTQSPNIASNTLDKSLSSKWSDNGDGGIITYDLGGLYTLESIKIATTGTSSKAYYYGMQFSTDGINYSAAVNVTSNFDTSYKTFPFLNQARFVKIIGGGNSSTAFTTISEIEFYGIATKLSVKNNDFDPSLIVYPNPASGTINLYSSSIIDANKAIIYSMDGRQLLSEVIQIIDLKHFRIDATSLINGTYLLKILDQSNKIIGTKKILIAN